MEDSDGVSLLQCYNKGCQQKYDPSKNVIGSCQFHPGGPIFHDALKGWSCCKKRSTDFTEFLNIPGCTKGIHSNVKPMEPQKEKPVPAAEQETTPQPLVPEDLTARPSASDPMVTLVATVGSTLEKALEKYMKEMSLEQGQQKEVEDVQEVKVGTLCKNSGCSKQYKDVESDLEACIYHPGTPIFHEGMKFWSCCQRKTTDFNSFLSQEGCERGQHLWIKKESEETKVACRHDWHQTGGFVTVSVFCKLTLPDKSWVQANKVACKIHLCFDGGKSHFQESLTLRGVIDPSKSNVKMLGSKVEINLKKMEPEKWKSLELPVPKPATTS